MNLRAYYLYHIHLRKLFNTDLHLFELAVWIQAFALSLISVFIPIIFWRLGMGFPAIVVYYLIFNLFDVPLNIVAQRFIERYGARLAIIVAIIAELLYFILLYNLTPRFYQILLLALAAAIFDTFYWVGHLYIFVQSTHSGLKGNTKLRSEVSILGIVRTVGGLLAPAIGALILIKTDQKTLIFFSTLMMSLSLIPIFKMRSHKYKPEQRSKTLAQFFAHPYEKINYLFQCFTAFRSEMEDVIWPFFIFLAYKNIGKVAVIPVIVSMVGMLLLYIAAKISVKKKIYQLVAAGTLSVVIIWLLRVLYYSNLWAVYASVFLIALSDIISDTPLQITVYDRGKKNDALGSVTYLNLFRMAARGALYLVILLMLELFGMEQIFLYIFYVCIGVLFTYFVLALIVSFYRKRLEQFVPAEAGVEIKG